MSCPLPGMDPYLEDEKLWPTFQHQLVGQFYKLLEPSLGDRYRARVVQRHYSTEHVLFTSIVREEHHEELIEIRERRDNRLVTQLDIVSPPNKTTPEGRHAYLEKRREAKAHAANLVEVDLILQGQPLLEYSRDGLPEWDYAVTVTRSGQWERHEIFTATVDKRLPRFRMPLASDDRDTVLDLQTAFTRAYDLGNFVARVDYAREPAAVLTDENRQWLHGRLKEHNLRK